MWHAHPVRTDPTTSTAPAGPSLLEPVRLVLVAGRFLTRLPFPEPSFREGDLRRATGAFPLIGAVVALLGIATYALTEPLWGAVVAVLLATAVEIGATGAFHEDGLADVADGLWGGWTVEDRLRIMRDSRLGTYGTTALLGALALRVAFLAQLDPSLFWKATLAGHVLGRSSILVMIRLLPPADSGGSGAAVSEPVGPLGWAAALVTAGAVLGVTFGAAAWLPLAAAVIPVLATRRLYRRRLGGVTGDALGATTQLVHLTTLAAMAALPSVLP